MEHSMRTTILASCVAVCVASTLSAQPKAAKPDDTPTFHLRARVVAQAGKEPVGKKFTFQLGVPGKPVTAAGSDWSDWLKFGPEQVEATLKGYPAIYLRGYPVVVKLQVSGVVDPTRVEAELKFDEGGEVVKLSGELFGPSLGILLWREDKKPRAATMAGYNRRYWKVLENVRVPAEHRPKQFPIVDRFIGGDDDRIAWQGGIKQLSRAGFSALMLPPSKPIRDLLVKSGLRRTAWAVYNPPGYAFAFDPKITPESLAAWAEQQAKPYREAGYAAEDMALFAMSDEPGWYFPTQFQALTENPAALARFRDYLKTQKLEPGDVGGKSWDDVQPLGRSKAKDLPSRRLFYWTMRFFAHDSAQHFATCTRALEKAFYPGVPVLTNWNFFSSRLYVPGPVANNPHKQDPDAAMGGHDWLEFGRLRGGTMLWTEDWFGDDRAYQWSFYCAKLRCAAEKGKVQFGGYVIPRVAGDREDGVLQKILCVTGSGGKAIKYFVFGPEYNFPGNCYSERAKVLPKMAEAHRMIGAAEELLWPGKQPRPQVAVLLPRSAQLWDAKDIALPRQIQDATNGHLNGSTVDYMAEVFDLYLALQHANIPVDFVDEDDLSPEGLKPYRVVYATEPNIPVEGQRGLAAWVRGGGTLVTVSGAGTRDRYDEPCTVLAEFSGIQEQPRERMLIANARTLKDVGKVKGEKGECVAVGVRGTVKATKADVLASFDDGSPAIISRTIEKGKVVHFAWLPGLSYWKSANTTKDRLPAGFSEVIRGWIVQPVESAKVRTPVVMDRPLVEAPLLLSEKGAAITLLNWTGEPQKQVKLTVRVPFEVASVKSVSRGEVKFEKSGEAITFSLPLAAADILMLRR
jgi:hypothetical protein